MREYNISELEHFWTSFPLPRQHEHEHGNDDVEGNHVDPDVGGER